MLATTLLAGFTAINRRGSATALLCSVFACFVLLVAYRALIDLSGLLEGAVLLGFAFYILRAIHFLLDCYRGRIQAVGWKEFIAWFWFLPTLQAGPIHRFDAFSRDLARRRWDPDLFNKGLKRILFGYAKVVLLGNYLVGTKFTAMTEALDGGSWLFNYLDTLRYGLLLYLRFAGYSDIAIGFALLLGFRVMENFNLPFLASNIVDFWRRWHISLSTWCKDYVYTPVLSFTRVPLLAALASMIVLGVWHEMSWRYLLWGVFHGAGIAVCQRWQRTVPAKSLVGNRYWNFAALILTQHFVLFSFTFTGLDSMQETFARWHVLFGITP
jgi:D-alanyl-lipoteichoic acid acyltransferase DltB (MBOAT superfamily)